MKIYTGTGDKGKTSLFSGERVSKSDARIDAYGDLDELNSILGALVAHLAAEKELPVLKNFILPGGHITSAWAHMARTVCRRCERKTVPLIDNARKSKAAEQYQNLFVLLNRLSDYLFVLARYCNHLHGVSDKLWKT